MWITSTAEIKHQPDYFRTVHMLFLITYYRYCTYRYFYDNCRKTFLYLIIDREKPVCAFR